MTTNDPLEGEPTSDRPRQVRQGDVLLVPVEEIPATARPVGRDAGRVVLAYGEVTGHAHAIRAAGARQLEADGRRYLAVADHAVTLEHEEHGPIVVAPGTYRIVIQREYVPPEIDPSGSRRVLD
jgi:hypothetical protein